MHLVILTQYYPPEIGAPQRRLSEMSQRMINRGHRVTVLTAMPNYPRGILYPGYGGLLKRELREGADVIRTFIYPTQKTDFVRRLTNYFSFIVSSSIMGSFLLDHPDYMLVESPPLFLGLAGFWLSRLKNARMIFNVADLWPECFVHMGILRRDDFTYRMSTRIEMFFYQHAWLVTGQSKSTLANISERFPDCPTFHLSNGVDTQNFHPDRRTNTSQVTLGSNSDECVALYAGLHGLAQGLDQVLDAAEMLRDEDSLRFVLVGDGPEKKSLLEKVRTRNLTNVNFLDPRPANEIPTLLASSDVALVVLKTYIPGAVPSKLYEAMACGRPVVLVASGEAADIVHEHKSGIVVKPGDVAGLAHALLELSKRSDLRKELGDNGRKAAEHYFDRTKIVERFIELLEANH